MWKPLKSEYTHHSGGVEWQLLVEEQLYCDLRYLCQSRSTTPPQLTYIILIALSSGSGTVVLRFSNP